MHRSPSTPELISQKKELWARIQAIWEYIVRGDKKVINKIEWSMTARFRKCLKRANLRIIKEEAEKDFGVEIIFKGIITDNVSNLHKYINIQIQESYRIPSWFNLNKTTLIFHSNRNQQWAGVAKLTSDKIISRQILERAKDGHYILIRGLIHKEYKNCKYVHPILEHADI